MTLAAGSQPDNAPGQADPSIRLAYLVLAHADPTHFGRMLHRLADPRVAFFVHLDAKVALDPFEAEAAGIANVTFVPNRIRVMWAGFSQVESTLRTIEAAFQGTTARCSHFVILSGADYPIASNDEILGLFASHPRRQFIRRFDILRCGDAHQVWRLRGYHFRELADRFTWKRRPLFALERALRILGPRRFPESLTFASGSNWCALTRDCAIYCARQARDAPGYVTLFRHTFGADEIFLHTTVQNSPFASDADPIEPYVDVTGVGGPWHYGNLHFLNAINFIRTAEEARTILQTRGSRLFARKVGTAQSQPALAVFDEAIGHTSR